MQAAKGRRGSRPEPLSESEMLHFSRYAKTPRGKLVASEGSATFSSGAHAHPANENDGMQPRESKSYVPQDISSRSGASFGNTGKFNDEDVGDSLRKLSTIEKCLSQPTQHNEQYTASRAQTVKCAPEEDDPTLFQFD